MFASVKYFTTHESIDLSSAATSKAKKMRPPIKQIILFLTASLRKLHIRIVLALVSLTHPVLSLKIGGKDYFHDGGTSAAGQVLYPEWFVFSSRSRSHLRLIFSNMDRAMSKYSSALIPLNSLYLLSFSTNLLPISK